MCASPGLRCQVGLQVLVAHGEGQRGSHLHSLQGAEGVRGAKKETESSLRTKMVGMRK